MNKNNNTVNLFELGFIDCGEHSWEFIDSKDFGDEGSERWKDPKTDKTYEIEWTRVRHIKEAVELPDFREVK